MSGSPRTEAIKPGSPTFLRRREERTADWEIQSVVPLPTATGGGAKSKWVRHLVAPSLGRPYAAISFAKNPSLVGCVDSPSASRALSNRSDSSVMCSPCGVQTSCCLLTAGRVRISPGLPPLLEEVLTCPAVNNQQLACIPQGEHITEESLRFDRALEALGESTHHTKDDVFAKEMTAYGRPRGRATR